MELITLESVLDVTEDGLVANWPVAPVEKELSSRVHSTPEVAEPPAYVALDENGSRELTGREYLALTADPSRYALFLDMIGVTRGGGCRASKVDRDGTVVPVVLSRAEAAVVVELVQAGHSMRPGEFRSVAATHVVKILERARHKLDISFGRYEWRAIQTLRANNRGAKAFQFHPPATMKWLVVVELDISESTAATRSR